MADPNDDDLETPEADALEQRREVGERDDTTAPDLGLETPEADAIEQAQDAGYDDDER